MEYFNMSPPTEIPSPTVSDDPFKDDVSTLTNSPSNDKANPTTNDGKISPLTIDTSVETLKCNEVAKENKKMSTIEEPLLFGFSMRNFLIFYVITCLLLLMAGIVVSILFDVKMVVAFTSFMLFMSFALTLRGLIINNAEVLSSGSVSLIITNAVAFLIVVAWTVMSTSVFYIFFLIFPLFNMTVFVYLLGCWRSYLEDRKIIMPEAQC